MSERKLSTVVERPDHHCGDDLVYCVGVVRDTQPSVMAAIMCAAASKLIVTNGVDMGGGHGHDTVPDGTDRGTNAADRPADRPRYL